MLMSDISGLWILSLLNECLGGQIAGAVVGMRSLVEIV